MYGKLLQKIAYVNFFLFFYVEMYETNAWKFDAFTNASKNNAHIIIWVRFVNILLKSPSNWIFLANSIILCVEYLQTLKIHIQLIWKLFSSSTHIILLEKKMCIRFQKILIIVYANCELITVLSFLTFILTIFLPLNCLLSIYTPWILN